MNPSKFDDGWNGPSGWKKNVEIGWRCALSYLTDMERILSCRRCLRPPEQSFEWSEAGLDGATRFLIAVVTNS